MAHYSNTPQHPIPVFFGLSLCFFTATVVSAVVLLLIGLRSEFAIAVLSIMSGVAGTLAAMWWFRYQDKNFRLLISNILKRTWFFIIGLWLLSILTGVLVLTINYIQI